MRRTIASNRSNPAPADRLRTAGRPVPRSGGLRAGLLAAALLSPGCRLPDFTPPGEPSNVVVSEALAFVSLGEEGIGVHEIPSRRLLTRIAPPGGVGSVDDLAIADGLLFALDAKKPGALAVFALAGRGELRLVAAPVEVPVGPFSGVAAAGGRAVVSGGTSELTVFRYDEAGRLAPERSRTDLGRGQPDVSIAADGKTAFVSTHFSLLRGTFGLTAIEVGTPPAPPRRLAAFEIADAGFSPGGARPANFPLETAYAGTTLFVAFGGGLGVVDASDPAAPTLLGVVPLAVRGVGVDARGDRVAVVGSAPNPTLVLLDSSRRASPVILAEVALPADARPTGVALADGFALVAAGAAGLLAVPLP